MLSATACSARLSTNWELSFSQDGKCPQVRMVSRTVLTKSWYCGSPAASRVASRAGGIMSRSRALYIWASLLEADHCSADFPKVFVRCEAALHENSPEGTFYAVAADAWDYFLRMNFAFEFVRAIE